MSHLFGLSHFGFESPSDSEEEEPPLALALTSAASEVADLLSAQRALLESQSLRLERHRQRFRTQMQVCRESLRQERTRWELQEKRAADCFVSEEEVVELDLGGQQQATTTLHTLRRFPESALAAMFSGRHPVLRHKGRALLDRDPETFTRLLSFLQTGRMPRCLNSSQEAAFRAELDFWGISPAPERVLMEFDPNWCADTLRVEGRTVRKTSEAHGIVLTCQPLTATCSSVDFQVQPESERQFRMFLGLVHREVYQTRFLVSLLWKDAPCSYYWDVLNHKLIKTDERGQHSCQQDYGCVCGSPEGLFGIHYDAESRTLSFSKNRADQGVAFTDVPEGLYPALDLWFASGSVSIL